jgi:hypothetical protein
MQTKLLLFPLLLLAGDLADHLDDQSAASLSRTNTQMGTALVRTMPRRFLQNPEWEDSDLFINTKDAALLAANAVGRDGLVVPSWLVLCWIAQGSGFGSQRGHLFFGILPRREISQEGFVQGLVSPPATGRYIGSLRIFSEALLVCSNGCWYLLKMGGWSFIT